MTSDHLERLAPVLEGTIGPAAPDIDREGVFPKANLDAVGGAGLLGLVSDPSVGGSGQGLRAATEVVRAIAGACPSTAMITCMHYAGTAVIEAHGPEPIRAEIARGSHLATLAFSERGSRSHFWAPVSSATEAGAEKVALDAQKSWVTAATEADSYVWSSRPLAGDGASTLWLVPSALDGVKVDGPFDGLGLRGNQSCPVTATDAMLERTAMLGADGAGFDIMMGVVLPWFSLMNAAMSIGIMDASIAAAAVHLGATRLEHLDETLADNPVNRNHLARAKVITDQTSALLEDALAAIEGARPDAQLRVLEIKAAAGDNALAVTDACMRVCGGAAFRREVGVERRFRDSRAATVMAPTSDALYDFIGKAVCGLPLF
jgi:alkylation response protein AidB-like acyl-CoA dehydrogenase